MKELAHKVAIITGASSGIGYATAKLFASEGARVVIGARGKARLDAVAAEIAAAGGEAIAVAGDVKDESFARALVEAALGRFGTLDVAFNNAGTLGRLGAVVDLAPADWQHAFDVNLSGAFLAAKHQIPAMLAGSGGGSIIFTSTFVGYTVGMPGTAAYAASKSGLIGLTQVLAAELGPKGIRVNAILPGGTDTPMAQAMIGTPEARAFVEGLHALKRIARPEEIARSVLYLSSDASSFTTGTALLVDGGVSINRT
jgi:NAD(P)-dependent dehydrogenase (short-subunit alcohol dehydrogenase family)